MENIKAVEVLSIRLKHIKQHPPAHPSCVRSHEEECEALETGIKAIVSLEGQKGRDEGLKKKRGKK